MEAWEAAHGRIPAGSWVLMRTDWSRREDPAAFLNASETGPHVPGPSVACMRFLVEQRDIRGWGVEAVGTDAGQAFAFEPPFPAHNLLHGAGKFGLASLCQLDQLPATGAVLITPPLKIENGSGSPLRVLALVAAVLVRPVAARIDAFGQRRRIELAQEGFARGGEARLQPTARREHACPAIRAKALHQRLAAVERADHLA